MPLIDVSYASQQSEEKKQELMRELTAAYARVMGIKESSVWVRVHELPRDSWSVGGTSLAELDRQNG